MDRRTFVFNAALGTLHLGLAKVAAQQPTAGAAGSASALKSLQIDLHAPDVPLSRLAMPGLFPKRVVEAYHPQVFVNRRVSEAAVRRMVEDGMKGLTGEANAKDAWARFVEPADVVALKVNPSGVPETTTSIPLVREVIRSLNAVGVPNKQIVVYDRNSNQLQVNGYHTMVPPGVRVIGLDERFVVDGELQDGYDRNAYCEMNCFGERETKSYLARLVSTEASKIINLPTLKEHNASGVTGCLKNLAYGSFNNVNRTHVSPKTYTDPVIAVMCSAAPVRAKAVLNIMDGLRAVYHSGPFAWNREFHWEAKTLLFGTDPVAVDRIELEIVEEKRRELGVPSLWDRNPANLGSSADMDRTAQKNRFYREPGHIKTAAELGLGTYEIEVIDRRRLRLT